MSTPNDPKARVVEIIDQWEKEAKDQERPAFWEDFIDRLDQAGLLAKGWVSIKDQLPSCDTWVLLYCKGKYPNSECEIVSGAWVYHDRGARVQWICDLEDGHNPTHWQPLPQPPKDPS